ncbi:MAG: sulfotransferase [Cyanobacteria bacterium]|nr:sulfotransferase [Cyanobacteriota bacterium]
MQPRSPEFIGIGAQKSGTYWLRTNLARHSGVWMPPVPEVHYFDRNLPGSNYPHILATQRALDEEWRFRVFKEVQMHVTKGEYSRALCSAMTNFIDHDDDWYRLLFSWAPPAALVGEITPRYAICGDEDIAHMRALAPEVKLIVLLRHPVDRFWSQCQMKFADGSLAEGDASSMRLFDSSNGRPRGEYSKTILRYCQHFDPTQILIVFMEGIQNTPAAVLRDIHAFLGLPPIPIDPMEVARRVNSALSPSPMPLSLRSRINAAYQSEMEILAEVLGGPAVGWLDGSATTVSTDPVLRLNANHVDELKRRQRQPLGLRPRRPDPLFCLSMQRNGTTTLGDWLESHGLERAGYPTSARLGWTMLWMQGEYEAIFRSSEFQSAEIFEDDPWWCPDFYRVLAERFPTARYILLSRDVNDWFDSLCHHSGGLNPGPTKIHARIYKREHHVQALIDKDPHCDPMQPGLLSVLGHESHYKSVYLQHNQSIRDFFAETPGRLFDGCLDNPQTLIDLCQFAGIKHNPAIPVPRSNARTAEMAQRLAKNKQAGLNP